MAQLPVIRCEERTLWASLQSKNEFHGSHVDDLAVTWNVLYCLQNIDSLASFALNTLVAHLGVDFLQALSNAFAQLFSRHGNRRALLGLHGEIN